MRESDAVIAIVDDAPGLGTAQKRELAMSRAPIWTAKILDLPLLSLILIARSQSLEVA